MEKYRNEPYWREYDPELFKTIIFLYKSSKILKYIDRFGKKIDYICNENCIDIPKDFKDIELINKEKVLKFPTSYNIVTDQINSEFIEKLDHLGFKIYYYNNEIIENYKYINKTIDENILKYTNRVSIELSNICNYSQYHLKCPLNKASDKKEILPLEIIEKILTEISFYNFSGTISYHTYNEPLIDPRLFYIIAMAKNKCPKAKIYILSNGFYFNQTLANELVKIGVDRIDITAYSVKEFERLKKIEIDKPYSIFLSAKVDDLDDRLEIYEKYKEIENISKPCYNVLNDIIITNDAKIDLCCLDWKREHCFGDLKKQSIKQIIKETEIYNIFLNLASGKRENIICKNCLKSHTKNILDFNFNGITYINKN